MKVQVDFELLERTSGDTLVEASGTLRVRISPNAVEDALRGFRRCLEEEMSLSEQAVDLIVSDAREKLKTQFFDAEDMYNDLHALLESLPGNSHEENEEAPFPDFRGLPDALAALSDSHEEEFPGFGDMPATMGTARSLFKALLAHINALDDLYFQLHGALTSRSDLDDGEPVPYEIAKILDEIEDLGIDLGASAAPGAEPSEAAAVEFRTPTWHGGLRIPFPETDGAEQGGASTAAPQADEPSAPEPEDTDTDQVCGLG